MNTGISLPVLLAAIFITLKLCHVIAWSWWWVLSPLLIGFGIGAAFLVFLYFLLRREPKD